MFIMSSISTFSIMDNEHNICDSKPNDGDDKPEDEYIGDNINEQ